MEIQLSIITVNFRSAESLERLVLSLQTLDWLPPTEWIIVDNSAAECSLQPLLEFPTRLTRHQIIENPTNPGYGAGCNLGAKHSRGEMLLFLNPDCAFLGGSFEAILKRWKRESKLGMIGPRIEDPAGEVEYSHGPFIGIWNDARRQTEKRFRDRCGWVRRRIEARFVEARQVDWVTGAAFFIPRTLFQMVGGFDGEFFLYYEDIDLCKRLTEKGYTICFDPSFRLQHGGVISAISKKIAVETYYRQSQQRYYHKHKKLLSHWALELYLRLSGRRQS